jgi:ketosteroid isomerase-like protein
MRKIILIISMPLFIISCLHGNVKENNSGADAKSGMIEADKAFSKLSEEKGMKAAFMENIDSNGVLLRPNSMPVIGVNAIDYISQENDTSYSMSWEPRGGSVAKSGELGYTYGVYLIKFKNKDSVLKGTYLSIWKKQPDGKWKFVMDTGNEGLGEP